MQPDDPDLLSLKHALDKLQSCRPRKALVVKLRYFLGMTVPEVADTLGVSEATVKLDWTFARAWLRSELRSEDSREAASR